MQQITAFRRRWDDSDKLGNWYWEKEGGGYIIEFGKNKDLFIRELSIRLLLNMESRCKKRTDFLKAVKTFMNGLEELVKTRYDRFQIPFGKRYRGKTIAECNDIPWFRWCLEQPVLTERNVLVFKAVNKWVEKPLEWDGHDEGVCDEGQGAEDYANDYGYDSDSSDSESEGSESESSLDMPLRQSQYNRDFEAGDVSEDEVEGDDNTPNLPAGDPASSSGPPPDQGTSEQANQ